MKHYAGIDAGSTYVKVVIMDDKKNLLGYRIASTGINACKISTESLEALCGDLKKAGVPRDGKERRRPKRIPIPGR